MPKRATKALTMNTLKQLTPAEIVKELDRHIIGQSEAKRAVAIALRNRWRRLQLTAELRDEVSPKNILMIGPTGVGKTEIARRLAKLANAPFIKVEATKFTEVGYVGRDVESIIRDLMDTSINMLREEQMQAVQDTAQDRAEDRILDILLPEPRKESADNTDSGESTSSSESSTRQMFRKKLRQGELDDKEIDIELEQVNIGVEIMTPPGMEEMTSQLQNMFSNLGQGKKTDQRLPIKEALKRIHEEEAAKLVNEDEIKSQALTAVEQTGIVFIDEIDKITSKSFTKSSDVNREGVQRDLLPLIEGTTINTKYASIKTNSILFIASGAFHLTTPSDLLPELQGRFPIKVNLNSLSKKDLLNILYKSKNSLPKQYIALFKAENVILEFSNSGLEAIAKYAAYMNNEIEDTGARRLYTLFSKILEKVNFCADKMKGQKLRIDVSFVEQNLNDIALFQNYDKFIL